MPDIEKRLEAFVRLAHGIVVFPGGAGTAEEILYLLGILLDPANASSRSRSCSPGPRESAAYFEQIRRFIGGTLGDEAAAALHRHHRRSGRGRRGTWCAAWTRCASSAGQHSDSYNFNWLLPIPPEFQQPFEVTHESMRALELHRDQPAHELAANLRRAFSGIVTGNVKEHGIQAIERLRPVRAARRSRDHAAAR